MPKPCDITVIVPTYNRATLVSRALESVFNQTVRPAQVIVVDDGSTDDTPEVCKKYGDRILYEVQRIAGPSSSRNSGVRLARYPWVAFLDSDDYWTPLHLERMVSAIRSTEGQALFYFADLRKPEADGQKTLWEIARFRPQASVQLTHDASAWVLMSRQPTMLQSSVICKSALEQVGGIPERFQLMHDTFVFCRLGVGGSACAVRGVGCVQTADDRSHTRVTVNIPLGSERNLAEECELWREVLTWEILPHQFRRLVVYNYAGAHLGLARRMWNSRRRTKAMWHLLLAAKSDPRLAAWIFRRGTSKGYEEVVRANCPRDPAERYPLSVGALGEEKNDEERRNNSTVRS